MIESEADFAQPFPLHGAPEQVAIVGIEQQKASAARAHQLAADCPIFAADLVPAIYAVVRSAGRACFFVQPMLMHQFPKAARMALLQRQLDAHAKLLYEMQVV